MTQPFRKTHLPQNKFYSAVDIPSSADEAGASSPAPTLDAPADISVEASGRSLVTGTAATDSCQEPVAADLVSDGQDVRAGMHGSNDCGLARDDVKPGDTMQESRPAHPATAPSDHLLQRLGSLDGTDLIHEIFAVKPKHFKLKHKRRLKLPPFAPDYEAMEVAMHNPGAPRALETDPVWADPKPLFLRDA